MQAAALAIVVGVGIWAYTRVVRPDREILATLAESRLSAAFQGFIEFELGEIDLVEGVTINNLRIPDVSGRDTFTAERVVIKHDILALASGAYVPTHVEIRGAGIWTTETEEGIALLFPFEAEELDPGGRVPRIVVHGGSLYLRTLPNSKRLRPGDVLEARALSLDVVPNREGRLRIEGSFQPKDMGHDDVRVSVTGWSDAAADHLKLAAIWKPLELNAELVSVLAPELREKLTGQLLQKGTLRVSIERDARAGEGELIIKPQFEGEVALATDTELPGGVEFGFRTREQLQALFDKAEIDIAIGDGGMINIRRLMKALATTETEPQPEGILDAPRVPSVVATGSVSEDLSRFNLVIEFRNLRFEDQKVRDALGAEGIEIYEQLDPRGIVNITVRVNRRADGEIGWEGEVEIEDASFRYFGTPAEDGTPRGFPYALEQAMGRIVFEKGFLRVEDIVGFNGSAVVRILGHHSQAWTGGATGRVLLTDEGPDVRLTIQAENVPVDDTLAEAIENSELAGLLDRFQVEGKIDEISIDIIKLPQEDVASAEVRVRFSDERFRYADFPLLLEKVKGEAQLRRPLLEDGERGRNVIVDVVGEADGSAVSVRADISIHEELGRLYVEAKDVSLEGEVARTIQEGSLTSEDLAPVWRFLDPRGRADVVADLPLEEDPGPLRIEVRLRGASIRLDAEEAPDPLVIEDIHGVLDVEDDLISLRGLEGRLDGIPVRVEGEIAGGIEGEWDIRIDTDQLRLDRSLLKKLLHYLEEPTLLPEGLRLESGARLAVGLRLRRKAGPDQELEAEVETRDLKARVRLLEGSPLDVKGQRVVVADGVVTLEDVEGEAPGIRIRAERVVAGEGPLEGDLRIELDAFEVSEELLALVPDSARTLLREWLEDQVLSTEGLRIRTTPDGVVRVDGDLAILAAEDDDTKESARGTLGFEDILITPTETADAPEISGTLHFRGFSPGNDLPIEEMHGRLDITHLSLGDAPRGKLRLVADRMTLFGIRARNVEVPFTWTDGILRAKPLRGTLAGGRLRGETLIHTREPIAYEGQVRLDDFSVAALRRDLAPDGPPYSGRGRGWIRFENRTGEAADLVARGSLAIHEGDLGELPGVANFKALFAQLTGSSNPPKFERAHAEFVLADETLRFRRLDLSGPIFDMPGSGRVDLDGQADLEFRPQFLKSLLLPGSMQIPRLGPFLGRVLNESGLYRVRLRGDLGSAEPELDALPGMRRGRRPAFEGTGPPAAPRRRIPRLFR